VTPRGSKQVVVTGATGLVGIRLVGELQRRGDRVIALTRDAEAARAKLGPELECIAANLETAGPWAETLAGARAVVHLAGESVGGRRWDARQKQKIRDSRVESTRLIVEAIAAIDPGDRPGALISASGADFYPFALDALGDDEPVTEIDPPSDSFLGRVCRDWEKEAAAAEAHGVRVACMRTGLVIGAGRAIAKLATPFKLFAGGRVGSGEQWVSWIALDDAAAAYAEAVHDERYRGPINLVTESVRNRDFAKVLGKVMHRPSWLPVPGFAVKAAAGELAEYVLHGRNVVPARLRELGYAVRQPDLAGALREALSTT